MKTLRTIGELRESLAGEVGLVPTMGALHDGHRALFRAARRENELVVGSLFVNPAQFDEDADLAVYPRDEAADARIAEECGVDLLFAPGADELYPEGFRTWVDVEGTGAEGEARPGHFRGVATVCLKLFNIVRPARAYFGQKDAQQALVIRRMVRDLNLGLEVRILPTVRDPDGLALSSRNVRLTPVQRAQALALPRALERGREAYMQGSDAVAAARSSLNGLTPEYVELIELDGATLLASAVRVGTVRLIDNVLLKGALTSSDKPPRYASWTAGKLPLPELHELKRRGEKIVMLTRLRRAERFERSLDRRRRRPDARSATRSGMRRCTAASTTLPVTLADIAVSRRQSVARGDEAAALVVADMPFGTLRDVARRRP